MDRAKAGPAHVFSAVLSIWIFSARSSWNSSRSFFYHEVSLIRHIRSADQSSWGSSSTRVNVPRETGAEDDNDSRGVRTENDFGPAVFHRCRHLCGLGSGLGCGVCDAVAFIGDAPYSDVALGAA